MTEIMREEKIGKRFQNACRDGNLELAKQLLEKYYIHDNSVITNTDVEVSFIYSGNLRIAQWLVEVFPHILNVVDEITLPLYRALENACEIGNLELVKWLTQFVIQVDPKGVEMYFDCFDKTEPFHTACIEGHLDIVKWMSTLMDDIEVDSETFYWTCLFGHLQVVEYLLTNPNIYVHFTPYYLSDCDEDVFEGLCRLINNGTNNEFDDDDPELLDVYLQMVQLIETAKPERYEITEVTIDENGKNKIEYKFYKNNDRPFTNYILK